MKYRALFGLCVMTAGMIGCAPSAEELRKQAISEFQLGRLEPAEKLFQQTLDAYAGDAVAYYYLGRIHYTQGRYEQAFFDFQNAAAVDTSMESARRWMLEAREKLGPAGPVLQIIPDREKSP